MAMTQIGALKIANPAMWERRIRDAMRDAGGSIPKAAENLGVSQRMLFRWLADPFLADVPRRAEGRPPANGAKKPAAKPRKRA